MTRSLLDPTTLAERFHALSDPTRLAILSLLERGECCVCDLQGALGAAQSRLSFHLRVLREAGLVVDRKDGRWSWYQIVPEAMRPLQGALDGFAAAVTDSPSAVPTGAGARRPAMTGRATVGRDLPVVDTADATGCCG
jgi:ArsR family transcriptional regulator